MATKEVYRIVTAEGHEHDWHGGLARLQEVHPGARITGRRVLNALGEGHYVPYLLQPAPASRKAAPVAAPASEPAADAAPAPTPAKGRTRGG